MNSGKTVFAPLVDLLPKYQFDKCVDRYNGNYKVKTFRCWEQLLSMLFAQLTFRESLRDIKACLNAHQKKLYHMGYSSSVDRSTLATANKNRDWRIYADFAQVLITEAKTLYLNDNDFAVRVDETAYAFDATTIDLCLALFPWAKFRKKKAAVKIHTLLDLRGNIPSFIKITDGATHEVNILDDIIIEPGAFYMMDKAYIDFERLHKIHLSAGYFVTRAKINLQFKRIESKIVNKKSDIKCD